MSKPYDSSIKGLTIDHPYDWAFQVGLPHDIRLRVIESELSSIIAAADRVILVEEPHRCLLNFEFMASHDLSIIERLLKYGSLLIERYRLPVHQTLVLLRREADSPRFTGGHSWRSPYGNTGLSLDYDIHRIWQQPVRKLLEGGVGLLPIAPLADDAEGNLPDVIREIGQRFAHEVSPVEAADLWTATYTLMGLRYPPGLATQLLRGVREMKESTTYQAILEEGALIGHSNEARRILLLQGRVRFGEPNSAMLKRLDSESGIERLEELAQRLIQVNSWEELLS